MIQLTDNPQENIAQVLDAAHRCYPNQPILADLTAAQAILESRLLTHPSLLARKYNNLFGIKGEGTDGSVSLITHEYHQGEMYEVPQNFASNLTLDDSINQHKNLLSKPRYQNLASAKDLPEAARMIQEDGYATDPSYASMLISIYNRYIK
jgi:flagellum-specific peptidoglycan hydrolase FlgJ